MVHNVNFYSKGLSGPSPTPTPGDNNALADESIYSRLHYNGCRIKLLFIHHLMHELS